MLAEISLHHEIQELKSKLNAQKEMLFTQEQELTHLRQQLLISNRENIEFYDYNDSIYFSINSQCLIQRANFQAARFLGIDRSQLLNKKFLNFVALHSQNTFYHTIQTLLDKKVKQTCEVEIIQKGGYRRYVLLKSELLKTNHIRLCLIDNTQARLQSMQIVDLERSLNLVNNLFQHATDAIAAVDSELKIKVLNTSFSELFSKIFTVKIQVGTNIQILLTAFPELKTKTMQACQQALRGDKTCIIIENNNPINKKPYYCYELLISSIYNQYARKRELIFHIRNLTNYKLEERRQHLQQANIARASRISNMGEMASALAHEINQPLTAINAYSRSCLIILNNTQQEQSTNDKLILSLKQIALQAEHAGEIIHNMKNFMNHGQFNVEETNINLLIEETLSIFNYELFHFKLKITLELMNDLPQIMTNKIHIMQVILNLARNSIEALQGTTKIKPELIIKTEKTDHHLVVHVIDNGPGIPDEFKDKILNTYFTTKEQGTGIGLGVCRSLIEAHGGELSVKKHTNIGAWFTFTLPIQSINLDLHAKK